MSSNELPDDFSGEFPLPPDISAATAEEIQPLLESFNELIKARNRLSTTTSRCVEATSMFYEMMRLERGMKKLREQITTIIARSKSTTPPPSRRTL